MCGISGILNHLGDTENINSMNKIMGHRGPDDTGMYVDKNVVLGHVRLSIIDLSEGGHQPMQIGSKVIVFNGEIYNYIELREQLIEIGRAHV